MWYIYLLRCSDKSLYCGITNNIERRLKAHQSGKGAKYTRGRLPVKLVYTECVETKSEALKRELKIKKYSKDKKEFMVNVVQLVRTPDCGSGGRGFEYPHSPHI